MIHKQSVFDTWPIESESVQAVITSPPYYALRKYSIPDVIIGGNKDCKHEWGDKLPPHKPGQVEQTKYKNADGSGNAQTSSCGSYCIHCNAWKGQYGLEPTPQMYVEHTRLWVKEAWRVLRNDGVFFLNLADSYSGSGCGTNDYRTEASKSINGIGKNVDLYKTGGITQKLKDYPKKCQLLIPHRVAIALVEDGWTLRNTIVWYKTNGMPESVTDRFSKKHEYVFMFTKSPDYYFDLDAVKEPLKESTVQRIKYLHGQSGSKHGELRKVSGKPQGDYSHLKDKNPGDVWQIPTQPSSEKHFAMWPEKLVERMIKCSTKAGDTVLDPFAGSGTTLKVSEELHRKGIGIDLGYEEISKRRTGKIQKRLFV